MTTSNTNTIVLNEQELATFKFNLKRVLTFDCKGAEISFNTKDGEGTKTLSGQKYAGMKKTVTKKGYQMPSKKLVDSYVPYAASYLDAVLLAYFEISFSVCVKNVQFYTL
jgi:hypothetical protein